MPKLQSMKRSVAGLGQPPVDRRSNNLSILARAPGPNLQATRPRFSCVSTSDHKRATVQHRHDALSALEIAHTPRKWQGSVDRQITLYRRYKVKTSDVRSRSYMIFPLDQRRVGRHEKLTSPLETETFHHTIPFGNSRTYRLRHVTIVGLKERF